MRSRSVFYHGIKLTIIFSNCFLGCYILTLGISHNGGSKQSRWYMELQKSQPTEGTLRQERKHAVQHLSFAIENKYSVSIFYHVLRESNSNATS